MRIGLRIDVDTFRGTRRGVPNLCRLLSEYDIAASFFFSVGPDNMGRHLWRLLRPGFARKMLRSKAPNLYGWDIIFKGTIGTGPIIGERLESVIREAASAGHEIGLHAWDHHGWQAGIEKMDRRAIRDELKKGWDSLTRILGRAPDCSAVPAWKCNDLVLLEKEAFPFRYNSDCRGTSPFLPIVGGKTLTRPQIPVTLPTYDEVVGRNGLSNTGYNDFLLSRLRPAEIPGIHVLTIHAEAEGMIHLEMFRRFVKEALSRSISFVPPGAFLKDAPKLGRASLSPCEIQGREGWAACQNTEFQPSQPSSTQ